MAKYLLKYQSIRLDNLFRKINEQSNIIKRNYEKLKNETKNINRRKKIVFDLKIEALKMLKIIETECYPFIEKIEKEGRINGGDRILKLYSLSKDIKQIMITIIDYTDINPCLFITNSEEA